MKVAHFDTTTTTTLAIKTWRKAHNEQQIDDITLWRALKQVYLIDFIDWLA